jgi:hypothetical protein
MREIKAIDNFFPKEMFERFQKEYLDTPMQYGWKGGHRVDPHGHWNYSFFQAGSSNLADYTYKLDGLLAKMCEYTKNHNVLKGENLALLRCYINGHTYGVDGYFHQDSSREDEITTVLYMNEEWFPNWAGETVFINTENKTHLQKSVLPYPNRMVLFPSIIPHAARGVSRKCLSLRQTFMFKFRKKRTADFERLSEFLVANGATNFKHQKGTLHDHLVRVYQILETKGFPKDICFGGGLHSVFGTNAFQKSLFNDAAKQKLIDNFSPRAVELAGLFSNINRPKYLETPKSISDDAVVVVLNDESELTIDRSTYEALCAIECANLIDQDSFKNKPNLHTFWEQNIEKNK